jgi:hypothetical protein
MSGSNGGRINKRKRYVLDEDSMLSVQDIMILRLKVAADFTSSANSEEE